MTPPPTAITLSCAWAHAEPIDTATDGDHVVVRLGARGTHRGDGLGMLPTNRSVDFRGMTWLTFNNGVVVEGWDSWNLGRLLESLR